LSTASDVALRVLYATVLGVPAQPGRTVIAQSKTAHVRSVNSFFIVLFALSISPRRVPRIREA
jgi:hypothetical protein